MKAQILQIRKTAAQITSLISDGAGALEAEEYRASAGRARILAAQKLIASCTAYAGSIDDQVGVHEADLDDARKCMQLAELKLQSFKQGRVAEDSMAVVRRRLL